MACQARKEEEAAAKKAEAARRKQEGRLHKQGFKDMRSLAASQSKLMVGCKGAAGGFEGQGL